jgi:hypothetical protein
MKAEAKECHKDFLGTWLQSSECYIDRGTPQSIVQPASRRTSDVSKVLDAK